MVAASSNPSSGTSCDRRSDRQAEVIHSLERPEFVYWFQGSRATSWPRGATATVVELLVKVAQSIAAVLLFVSSADAQTSRSIHAQVVRYRFSSGGVTMPSDSATAALFDGDGSSYTFGNLIRSQSYGRWTYAQTITPVITLSGNTRCLSTNDVGALESAAKAAGFTVSPGANTPVIYWLPTGGQTAPCDNTIRSGQSYILQSGSIEHLHTIWTWAQGIPMAQFLPCQNGSQFVVLTPNCQPTGNRTYMSASGQGPGGFTAWEKSFLGILAAGSAQTIGAVSSSTPFTLAPLGSPGGSVYRVIFSSFGFECEYHQPGPFENAYEQDGLVCYRTNTNQLLDLSPDGQFRSPFSYALNRGQVYTANGQYLTVTATSSGSLTGAVSNTPPPVEQTPCDQSPHGTQASAVTGPNCERWTLGLRYSPGSPNFQALKNGVHIAGGYGSGYLICGDEVYLQAGGYFRFLGGVWQSIGGQAPCAPGSIPPPPPPPIIWDQIFSDPSIGVLEQRRDDPRYLRWRSVAEAVPSIYLRQDP